MNTTPHTNTQRQIAHAVASRISKQFPDSNEGRLMFAVVDKALRELNGHHEEYRTPAARYLRGRILHAEVAGVDPEWIHNLMRSVGLDLTDRTE